LLAEDIPMSFRIVKGYAVGSILNVAHDEDADMIVINSSNHRQSHFQLHGNVAEGVLRQAHCPVCCCRQPVKALAPGTNPQRKIAKPSGEALK
jgi:nucleotide-binding universal stress UspA family protein